MTKEFAWHDYTLKITKKKVKRANLRIKPEEPNVIYISVPYQISYSSALQILEQPKIVNWLANYEKKVREKPLNKKNWYGEQLQQESLYRDRLQELLPEMFAKWESKLGIKANKVTIRDTRAQWGSCNVLTKNISISVWLGAFPEKCIEYVVVHELVHLLEKGHNQKFYGYLDIYFPDWKEYRRKLKERAVME